jgi:uncharacterized membrane protein YvlD (DUF360 family)
MFPPPPPLHPIANAKTTATTVVQPILITFSIPLTTAPFGLLTKIFFIEESVIIYHDSISLSMEKRQKTKNRGRA